MWGGEGRRVHGNCIYCEPKTTLKNKACLTPPKIKIKKGFNSCFNCISQDIIEVEIISPMNLDHLETLANGILSYKQ